MKRIYLVLIALSATDMLHAQYASTHYIAPSPWQYWSDANEIVLSTKEEGDITVALSKSDGTPITSLVIASGNPVSYRFDGEPADAGANSVNTVYEDRGLIVTASAPVLVNLRNIASDSPGTNALTIKGNASLVSFGNEGVGNAFRLGYYRVNYAGLNAGAPVYAVMAIEDETAVALNGTELALLNAGESFLFHAPMGALLTSDKLVVANTGTYGDLPQACGGGGEDGAVDQIAPVSQLGLQYILVRGNGMPGTSANHPEQSTIITSEPNTVIQVTHYTPQGIEISTSTENVADAGGFINLFHGDAENEYSSTFVTADKPVIIYSASAVDCETDISTVLPIGGCSGSNNISTRKFINYSGSDLPYFGYVILESAENSVYVNGQDMEDVTGMPRIQIGDTDFYMLRFTNFDLGSPDSITITSDSRLTTSIIQQGNGFSMSGFFSAFTNAPNPPEQITAENCAVTLVTEEGLEPYEWYLDEVLIPGATGAAHIVQQTGNYTVSATDACGVTPPSAPVYALAAPPVTAATPENMAQCVDMVIGNTFNLSLQDSAVLGDQDPEEYTVTYHLSPEDAEAGVNPYTELSPRSDVIVYAKVAHNEVSCHAVSSFELRLVNAEINMPSEYYFCEGGIVNIEAPEGFISYSWSGGQDTPSIIADTAGTITLTAILESNGVLCEAVKEITVIESAPATIQDVIVTDWTNSQNSITILADNEDDFEFSINGTTYQDSPLFDGLEPGAYTVYAREKNGCGIAEYEVHLLMYPNFFTPNGDGSHENWRIHHGSLEPEMIVYIYDRYGKSLTSFNGGQIGWDGTFNGSKMPATDYWFVVERADGRTHKGHFTLKR